MFESKISSVENAIKLTDPEKLNFLKSALMKKNIQVHPIIIMFGQWMPNISCRESD